MPGKIPIVDIVGPDVMRILEMLPEAGEAAYADIGEASANAAYRAANHSPPLVSCSESGMRLTPHGLGALRRYRDETAL